MALPTTERQQLLAEPHALERYVAFASSDLGDQVVIAMRPEHWLSTDMGAW